MRIEIVHKSVAGFLDAWLVRDELTDRHFVVSQHYTFAGPESRVTEATDSGQIIGEPILIRRNATHEKVIAELEDYLEEEESPKPSPDRHVAA